MKQKVFQENFQKQYKNYKFCYNQDMSYTDAFEKIFGNKKKVLVVSGHPDDLEIMAGGTVARLVAEGKEVRSVKVTLGDKGSQQQHIAKDELTNIRLKEDTASMHALGITDENNVYLKFPDGGVENNLEVIAAIARQIRLFQPDIVITHNPEDKIIRFAGGINWVNHRDHRNAALSTVDAVYPYSRDLLHFPEQLQEEGAISHICSEFLFFDYYDGPDIVAVDVTDFIETRVKAHASHLSQYSQEDAQGSADFFTKLDDSGRRYERFRYVIAD